MVEGERELRIKIVKKKCLIFLKFDERYVSAKIKWSVDSK